MKAGWIESLPPFSTSLFLNAGIYTITEDDEIMLNAAKYQKDWDVEVDVCRDKSGNLTIGTGSGLRYVAQVMIPAATYTETEIPAEDPAEAPAAEDAAEGSDGMNQKTTVQSMKPFFLHQRAIAAHSALVERCQPWPLASQRARAVSKLISCAGSSPGRLYAAVTL